MRAFKDDRGRSYNAIFPHIKGDVNIGILYPGTIKAFHRHAYQDDYWFIASGHVRAVLVEEKLVEKLVKAEPDYQTVGTSATIYRLTDPLSGSTAISNNPFSLKLQAPEDEVTVHYLSEGEWIYIPAGVWHGVQNIGTTEAIMIYHITQKYNKAKPDEERAEWNKWYDWKRSKK